MPRVPSQDAWGTFGWLSICPKKAILNLSELRASGQTMPEPSSSRIAWCHPALIAFIHGVSAS
eukprot:scaffold91414_cov45-Phaeocystis_antarctica.AAC.1